MTHSKRYQELLKKVPEQALSIEQAVEFIKKNALEKFDPTLELHVRLGIDAKQSDQTVRGAVSLPAGTGKSIRIAAVAADDADLKAAREAGADLVGSQEIIDQIKKGKLDFDVLVATPDMMPRLGKVAKILGPKGLMPNPKTGTVGPDMANMIRPIKQGKANFKNDESGIVHLAVGKKSFKAEDLEKNIQAALEAVRALKPANLKGTYIKNVTLSSSMGPGLRLAVK